MPFILVKDTVVNTRAIAFARRDKMTIVVTLISDYEIGFDFASERAVERAWNELQTRLDVCRTPAAKTTTLTDLMNELPPVPSTVAADQKSRSN